MIEGLDWLSGGPVINECPEFVFDIDEFFTFKKFLFVAGRCRHASRWIEWLFVVFNQSIVLVPLRARAGSELSFDFHVALPDDQTDANVQLGFALSDGSRFLVTNPTHQRMSRDPGHRAFLKFVELAGALKTGKILEIGSRARSGTIYRSFIPGAVSYTGFDIKAGVNVDVVGDAHALSAYFGAETFDAAYSIATFEHLMMPWKVAVELNKIMKVGGVVFIGSHQTFPLHEEPWDFWRFSDAGWRALFNKFTGFEIIDTSMGERAYVVGGCIDSSYILLGSGLRISCFELAVQEDRIYFSRLGYQRRRPARHGIPCIGRCLLTAGSARQNTNGPQRFPRRSVVTGAKGRAMAD